MAEPDRTKYLRIALFPVGLIFIIGIYPLTIAVSESPSHQQGRVAWAGIRAVRNRTAQPVSSDVSNASEG